jgi:BlaI family transcriptional regulator, penicillinase repressor
MKSRTRKGGPSRPLTSTELEMMNVIWRLGACTVSQVQAALSPERELAYTSISTIVRILEQKGFVKSEKAGRGHLYSATMSKEEYQGLSLQHLVNKVFDDTPSLLVQRLLDSGRLTEKELAEIRSLLRKKGG